MLAVNIRVMMMEVIMVKICTKIIFSYRIKMLRFLHICRLSYYQIPNCMMTNIKDGQDFINNLGMITMLLVIVLGDDDSDEDDNEYNALGRALSATNRDLEKK